MNKTTKECAEAIVKIIESEPEMADGVIRGYMKQIGKLAKVIIENEEHNNIMGGKDERRRRRINR